jgi:hypothetical protein
MSDRHFIQVVFAPTFKRNLRNLAKKSEQVDIAADEIRNIISEYEQRVVEDE